MAAGKKKNFKAMADDDLRKELDGLRKSLHGLRTQTVTSTVENKSQFRSHRRDIARILTEVRARELKESPSAKATGDKPVRGPKPAVTAAAAPAPTPPETAPARSKSKSKPAAKP